MEKWQIDEGMTPEQALAYDEELAMPAQCEDFPCCGHEQGDCNGQLYGSDEDIKAEVYRRMTYDDQYDYYNDAP